MIAMAPSRLLDSLRQFDPSKLKGTLTVAFVVQQWTGARGLQRVLERVKPDEMLYVGRLMAGGVVPGMQTVRRAPRQEMGSGVLIGLDASRRDRRRFSGRDQTSSPS